MRRIIFWNVEHLSPHQLAIVKSGVRAKERMVQFATNQAKRHARHGPTRAVTRGMVGVAKRRNVKDIGFSREEIREARSFSALDMAERKLEQYKNKEGLSADLPHSAPDVFYCEVGATHPHARSPHAGVVAAGGATLCYARYSGGVSVAFPACPTTNGWYAGLPLGLGRVPKAVAVNGTAGPVRFCFWHAPSGNDGTIVQQMFAGLNAGMGATPFVLFGDLNAEPADLILRGVPPGNIIAPPGMTRISGRCLDYAITNVPGRFLNCRPLYPDAQNRWIKTRTGSDHMVMVLELA